MNLQHDKNTMATLEELYKHHIEGHISERETVQEAQRLFPYTWKSIFTLMNNTIKQKEQTQSV